MAAKFADGGCDRWLARAELPGIVAPLNFLMPMAEKPYSYNYEPPPGVPLRNTENIEHAITVRDARAVAGALSLDREGFVLLHHRTAAADLYDEAIIMSVHYPECERLMREATGAKRVVAFDHIVRNEAKAAKAAASRCRPAASTTTTPPSRRRSACAT